MTKFNKLSAGTTNQLFGSFAILIVLSVALYSWLSLAEAEELLPLTIDTDLERVGDHPWKMDSEQSSLKIRINQKGSLIEGVFANWDAQINLDPENLDTAFVDARIDMTSLELGEFSDHAKSVNFLNVASHAEARFLSDFFWLRGDGKVDAEGLLEIAGVTQPFVLTFGLGIDGQRAAMNSYTAINRMDYQVGAEEFSDEESVGFGVEIAIDMIAEKQW